MQTSFSRYGLNVLNFFVAAVQTGFGPFVSVYLTQEGWRQTDIGVALSVGTAAALVSQLPAGALVDAVHLKRNIAAVALLILGLCAIGLAFTSGHPWIWGIQILHSIASSVLTPAIAALTLSLCGHALYSQRLGVNARFASLGNAFAAGLMGLCAQYLSERYVFLLTAALVAPAIAGVVMTRRADGVSAEDDHPALLHPRQRRERDSRFWHIFKEPALHVFAFCTVLFGVANAGMLPLALNTLTLRTHASGFVVSAAVVVPQLVAALAAPAAGALAQRIGRRPVLLLAFVALPARALVFATDPGAVVLVAAQVLDGLGATVMGLMLPLIAADLTQRTGFLNLAIGALGLGATFGAMASTTMAGYLSDQFGSRAAFLSMAAAGALGAVLLVLFMPETRPVAPARQKARAPAE